MPKNFYLITTEPANVKMVSDNARKLGEIRFLLSHTFVLVLSEEKELSEIRASLSGENRLRCLVIKLDSYINSAWSMSKESSDYLKSIFSEIYGEEETSE